MYNSFFTCSKTNLHFDGVANVICTVTGNPLDLVGVLDTTDSVLPAIDFGVLGRLQFRVELSELDKRQLLRVAEASDQLTKLKKTLDIFLRNFNFIHFLSFYLKIIIYFLYLAPKQLKNFILIMESIFTTFFTSLPSYNWLLLDGKPCIRGLQCQSSSVRPEHFRRGRGRLVSTKKLYTLFIF
jgi:hypothetical protein